VPSAPGSALRASPRLAETCRQQTGGKQRRFYALLPALLCALPFLLTAAVTIRAASLKPEAEAAFDRYVKLTEQRIDSELAHSQGFLWIDRLSPIRRTEMERELRDAAVVIDRLETRDGPNSIQAPGALIHDWVAIVFVPGVQVDAAVGLMEDYDRHSQVFAPNIVSSKTLERNGSHFRVALRFFVKKVIGVTMDTENDADFVRVSPDRAYSRIRSTRVSEIADAGTPQERPKREGHENGFMWRLNTYWRFLGRDGGTYIQCESVTLSRDVPFALRWIIKPFVTQVPKESLRFTLERARTELLRDRTPSSSALATQ
jgi:hypothetical protein